MRAVHIVMNKVNTRAPLLSTRHSHGMHCPCHGFVTLYNLTYPDDAPPCRRSCSSFVIIRSLPLPWFLVSCHYQRYSAFDFRWETLSWLGIIRFWYFCHFYFYNFLHSFPPSRSIEEVPYVVGSSQTGSRNKFHILLPAFSPINRRGLPMATGLSKRQRSTLHVDLHQKLPSMSLMQSKYSRADNVASPSAEVATCPGPGPPTSRMVLP